MSLTEAFTCKMEIRDGHVKSQLVEIVLLICISNLSRVGGMYSIISIYSETAKDPGQV